MERIAVRRPCSETRSGHERIMSIPPNNEADSDEKFHVGVCYRHGVAVYKDTGGDTFRVWLGEYVVTADSEAGLLLGGVRWTSPAP